MIFIARSSRITSAHGEANHVTNINAWPWLVHMDGIDVYDEYGSTNQGCMGVIITKNHVLTSAKCCTFMGCAEKSSCDPNKNTITTGKQKVSFEALFFSEETDHKPAQAHIHPNWNVETGKNDICVVKLADDIDFV